MINQTALVFLNSFLEGLTVWDVLEFCIREIRAIEICLIGIFFYTIIGFFISTRKKEYYERKKVNSLLTMKLVKIMSNPSFEQDIQNILCKFREGFEEQFPNVEIIDYNKRINEHVPNLFIRVSEKESEKIRNRIRRLYSFFYQVFVQYECGNLNLSEIRAIVPINYAQFFVRLIIPIVKENSTIYLCYDDLLNIFWTEFIEKK